MYFYWEAFSSFVRWSEPQLQQTEGGFSVFSSLDEFSKFFHGHWGERCTSPHPTHFGSIKQLSAYVEETLSIPALDWLSWRSIIFYFDTDFEYHF